MMRYSTSCCLALALTLLASSQLTAASARDLTLAEMTELSTDIFEATVESIDYVYYEEKGQVYTDVTLQLTLAHKTSLDTGRKVVLRLVGGKVGARTVIATGNPSFSVGKDVLVFAQPIGSAAESQIRRPLGLSMGVFHVTETPQGAVASRDLSEMHIEPDIQDDILDQPEIALEVLRAAIHSKSSH